MQQQQLTTNHTLINGRSTNYWQKNPKAMNKVVLCLHGFMSDLHSLVPFVDSLNIDADSRLLLPDLPGFGSSVPLSNDASINDYMDWANAFVRHVAPEATHITLIGYSFGAYIAIKLAAEDPAMTVDKLILITPVVKIAPQVRLYSDGFDLLSALSMRAAHTLYVWPPSFDFTTYYLTKTKDKTVRQKLRLYRRQELATLRPEIVLKLYRRLADIDLMSSAAQLNMPVIIIMAKKDNVAFTTYTKTFMKHIVTELNTETLREAGHLVPFEDPQLLASIVNQYGVST